MKTKKQKLTHYIERLELIYETTGMEPNEKQNVITYLKKQIEILQR